MLNKVDLPGDDSPDDVMVGKCPVCGSVVNCLRREMEMREWFGGQLPSAPCPRVTIGSQREVRTCGTRIHMSKKRSS